MEYAVLAVICLAVGAWGYRYMAKRNPETVAKWAADLKTAGKRVEGFMED